MGLNLSIKSQTFATPEDHSWLGDALDAASGESITLKASLFASTPFPSGIVKSGTVLARVTATPTLWGPYDSSLSNGQELAIGVLLTTVDLTGGIVGGSNSDSGGALLWRGRLIKAKMPQGVGVSSATPGALDTLLFTPVAVAATTAVLQSQVSFQARFRMV